MRITFSKIRSSILDAGKRILKIEQYGVKTVQEVSSFGDDGNPVKNMTAIYADTDEVGEPVIIGYVNENQLASVGEKRLYSLDVNGNLSFYIWLKNNGIVEIGGNSDNAVRYTPLDSGITAKDALINTELVKIAAVLNTLIPGSYVPTPVSTNITGAKINEIKIL